jgi:hypothetical protein
MNVSTEGLATLAQYGRTARSRSIIFALAEIEPDHGIAGAMPLRLVPTGDGITSASTASTAGVRPASRLQVAMRLQAAPDCSSFLNGGRLTVAAHG